MSEFNWGDPHPLAIDRRKRKHESDKRAATNFVDVLLAADTLYLRDADGVADGLALFDREVASATTRKWGFFKSGICVSYVPHIRP